jgi:hypothetical protein
MLRLAPSALYGRVEQFAVLEVFRGRQGGGGSWRQPPVAYLYLSAAARNVQLYKRADRGGSSMKCLRKTDSGENEGKRTPEHDRQRETRSEVCKNSWTQDRSKDISHGKHK